MEEGSTSTFSKEKAVLDSESVTETVSEYEGTMSWSNAYEFLFTCLLYVVGLGNIIRFPELVYTNGGGKVLD